MSQSVPPETVALVRRRYVAGDTVAAIQAATGIKSSAVLYAILGGRYDDGSSVTPARIARRREGLRIARGPSRRKSLVARIWRNAEAQVEQIETRLATSGMATEEFERDARSRSWCARCANSMRSTQSVTRASSSGNRMTSPYPEILTNSAGSFAKACGTC